MSDTMDAVDAYHAAKPKRPLTLLEAFANTAKALQQFGLERIRVVGLSKGCLSRPHSGFDPTDGIRVVTEHEFMREFVFLSRPCIILDAIEDWPAMQKWRSDRYVFDLDGHLPLVEQRDTSSDEEEDEEEDDEENEYGEKEDRNKRENEIVKVAEESKADAEPRPLGPKRFTIALTPNGRADAVTHVLYDVRDVPEERREEVFAGKTAQKAAVLLKDHPLLTQDAILTEEDKVHLRLEKIFMYAAEVKMTLPELYKLLLRGPKHLPETPTYIDMRQYKHDTSAAPHPRPITPVIAYAQLQNNCLNTEFTHVHADIATNVEAFGTRVFGEAPEAANVWFGIPASVSSLHQDWVENLYPVVRGVKEFLLIPPWEGVFVPKPDIPSAAFELDETRTTREDLTFAFKPYPGKDGTVIPWMDFDFTSELLETGGEAAVLEALNDTIVDNESRKEPIQLNNALFSLNGSSAATAAKTPEEKEKEEAERLEKKKLKELHPLVANVHPGETLYLPAMWLHRVAQHADEMDIRARAHHLAKTKQQQQRRSSVSEDGEEESTVDAPPLPLIAAVNYWYNMNFANPAVVMLREFGLLL